MPDVQDLAVELVGAMADKARMVNASLDPLLLLIGTRNATATPSIK